MSNIIDKLSLIGYKHIDLLQKVDNIDEFWRPELLNADKEMLALNIVRYMYIKENQVEQLYNKIKDIMPEARKNIVEILYLIEDSLTKDLNETIFNPLTNLKSRDEVIRKDSLMGWSIREIYDKVTSEITSLKVLKNNRIEHEINVRIIDRVFLNIDKICIRIFSLEDASIKNLELEVKLSQKALKIYKLCKGDGEYAIKEIKANRRGPISTYNTSN